MGQGETFSIRQLIELSGLSEFTIRGWESRYSAFSPIRSETGRREYLKSDVERALLLRELLKRDHKIGKIAGLSNRQLKGLFEQTEQVHGDTKLKAVTPPLVAEASELVALQKWTELEELIANVPTRNASRLVSDFFLPLIRTISADVAKGILSISQEHVVSSLIKEKIYAALTKLNSNKKNGATKSRFVLATPEGDFHEIGLLLGHLLIRASGYHSLYLGPHVPARDLAETALRFNATHLFIVSTVSKRTGARQELLKYISDVQQITGSEMPMWIAGSQAPLASKSIESLTLLRNFSDLEEMLIRRKAKS